MRKNPTRKVKVSDGEVARLLKRYECPRPFHAVRAFMLGSIANPNIGTHPLQALQVLWDGDMPEFESMDDAKELFGALIQGMWNRLTQHQSRKHPLRLTALQPPTDIVGLRRFAGFAKFAYDHEAPEDISDTVCNMQELSVIANKEINSAIVSCAKARRASLEAMQTAMPARH